MKNVMFLVMAILLVAGSVFAQGTGAASATVTAVVTSGLTVTALDDGNWSELTQGQCYWMKCDGFMIPPSATLGTNDITPPGFNVDGNPGDRICCEFHLPAFLTGDAGGRIYVGRWDWCWQYGGGDFTTGFNGGGDDAMAGCLELFLGPAGVGSNIYLSGHEVCVPAYAQAGTYTALIIAQCHYLDQP